MTEGKASTRRSASSSAANQFGFTFNWAYVSRKATAFFTSGLPAAARRAGSTGACRRSAPASYEWQRLPAASASTRTTSSGPGGLLLNWNNQSAPGFMHGDDEPYGSVHRVELFDRFPRAGQAHRRRRAS